MSNLVQEFTNKNTISRRAEEAMDYTMETVSAGAVRTVPRLAINPVEVTTFADYIPLASDGSRCICGLGGSTHEESQTLHTTTDGVTFTKIADRTEEPFSTFAALHSPSSVQFTAVFVMGNGGYLACLSRRSQWAGGDAPPLSRLFYSADQGQTWTAAGDLTRGYFVEFTLTHGLDDQNQRVAAVEYGSKQATGENARAVYLTENYGQTWEQVFLPDNMAGQHGHKAIIDPQNPDKIYVSYGDGTTGGEAQIRSIVKSSGVWAETWSVYGPQPTTAFGLGGKLVWGSDHLNSPTLMLHDTSNDSFSHLYTNHRLNRDRFAGGSYVMSFGRANGIYYMPLYTGSSGADYPGIYISRDARTWQRVSAYGLGEAAYGGCRVFGGVVGDKVFIGLTNVAGARGLMFDVPSMNPVDAILTAPPSDNLFSAVGADLTDGDDISMISRSGSAQIAASTDDPLFGTHCIKVTLQFAENARGDVFPPRVGMDASDPIKYTPQAGEIYILSGWFRYGANPRVASPTEDTAQNVTFGFSAINATINVDYVVTQFTRTFFFKKSGWEFVYGICHIINSFDTLGEDDGRLRPRIRFNYCDAEERDVFIDGLTLTRLKSPADAPLVIDSLSADYAQVPKVGHRIPRSGDDWTISTFWFPEFCFNIATDLTETGDVSLLSIHDKDGGKVELLWNFDTQKIRLEGPGSTTIDTADEYKAIRDDIVHIAVVGNASGVKAYIHDPQNGAYSLGDLTTAGLSGFPVHVELGSSEASRGYGSYALSRVFDKAMSEAEVNAVFADVTAERVLSSAFGGGLLGGNLL